MSYDARKFRRTLANAALEITPQASIPRKVKIRLFFRCPMAVKIELRLFVTRRQRLERSREHSKARSIRKFRIDESTSATESQISRRIRTALGDVPLFSGGCELSIPESVFTLVRYCGISILAVPLEPKNAVPMNLYVERKKHAMGLGDEPKPALAFPLSAQQIAGRIDELIEIYGFRPGQSSIDLAVLEELLFALYAGKDSPLTAETLEVSP